MYFLLSIIVFGGLLLLMRKSKLECLLFIIVTMPTLKLFRITGGLSGWNMALCVLMLLVLIEKKTYVRFPFKMVFLLFFISYLFSCTLGKYNGITSMLEYLQFAFMSILVWYLYEPSRKNLKFLFTLCSIYYTIVAFYGYYEALSLTKPFHEWLNGIGYDKFRPSGIPDGGDGIRFGLLRAYSITVFNTEFAVTCAVGMIFMTHLVMYQSLLKIPHYIAFFVIFIMGFGVFCSGDRSAIVMSSIFMLSLLPMLKSNKKWILAILLTAFTVYLSFQDYFELIFFSITHSDEVTGSSIGMRLSQLDAAIDQLWVSPIWGQGVNATGEIASVATALLGAESYIFVAMLNFGMLGLLAFGFYIYYVVLFLFKKKVKILLPVFLGYIVYDIMAMPMPVLYICPFILILYKNYIAQRRNNYISRYENW